MASLADFLDGAKHEAILGAEARIGAAPGRRERLAVELDELIAGLRSGRPSSGGWTRAAAGVGAEAVREHDALHGHVFAFIEEHRLDVALRELRLLSDWRDGANNAVHAFNESRLGDQNRRYAMLLDSVDDTMLLTDVDDGGFLYVNRVAAEVIEKLSGRARDGIAGRTPEELGLPAEFREKIARMRALVKAGRPADEEVFITRPEGRMWRENRVRPVLREDGRVEAVAVISREVTERKMAETRLKLMAKMSALAEELEYDGVLGAAARLSIPELADVCIVDAVGAGVIRRAGVEHHEARHAAAAAELSRRPPDELYRTRAGRDVLAGNAHLVEAGDPALDAALAPLDARSILMVPFVVLGTTVAVATFVMTGEAARRYGAADLAMAVDLARRAAHLLENARLHEEGRRVQKELAQTLAFREQVIGMLGHDLRNPLSAVLGIVALARLDGELPEPLGRHLQEIEAASRRMVEMIGALLDFAHTRFAGELPLQPAPTDLRELSARVVAELKAANPERAIELDADGDARGEWDPGRIAEVVSNLAGNALEHGDPRGPVRVTVAGAGEDVRLEVHNRGPAIAADLMPQLFEPFRRGHEANGRARTRGLGLGLYIARQIVVAHGGSIAVRSFESEGTTFAVRLPKLQRV